MLKQLYFDQLKEAFVKFDRSEEVDEAARNAYAEAVRNDEITSSRVSDETLILEEALHYVDAGEEEGAQWKRIRSSLNQPVEKFKLMLSGRNVSTNKSFPTFCGLAPLLVTPTSDYFRPLQQ